MLSVTVKNESMRIHNIVEGRMVISSPRISFDAHPTANSEISKSVKTGKNVLRKEQHQGFPRDCPP